MKRATGGEIVLAVLLACLPVLAMARGGHPQGASGERATSAVQAKPAAADAWYGRTKGSFQVVRAPDQRFQFECPTKDWTIVGGAGPVPVLAVGKRGEVFAVERALLNRALDQADIGDLFVQLEAETIKERLPLAADFQPRIIEAPDRRVVAIEFTRPAANGTRERARQYSIAAGTQLYRLTCASPGAAFSAYGPTCAHIVASFTIAPARTQ